MGFALHQSRIVKAGKGALIAVDFKGYSRQ